MSMIYFKYFTLLLLLLLLHCASANEETTTTPTAESIVQNFLDQVNQNLAELYDKEILAAWQNEIKGPNDLIAMLQSEIAAEEITKYLKSIWPKTLKYNRIALNDAKLKHQLQQIPEIGYEVLKPEELEILYAITANMSEIYKNVELCDYEERSNCNLTLIPDIQNRLYESQNMDEIQYYWLQWRDKTGIAARSDFIEFVKLYRKTAKLNGYPKPSDFWFKDLEENSHEAMRMLKNLFKNLRPFFLQFHAHVRQNLRQVYGDVKIPLNKPYPQSLAEIYIGRAFRTDSNGDITVDLPYPEIGLPNITKGLHERGLTNARRAFWNVAEFYRSLGMEPFDDDFWQHHAKPKAYTDERYATCSHKAWHYFGLHQLSLSYCPNINEEHFFNMFEAMAELYYYKAVQAQPTLFQEEPFPNFSEALGKMFALAASTPTFLESLKIVESGIYTQTEARINRLYMQGLRTIFLLPVYYVLDLYRVEVLDNKINITDNCAYWRLVEKYTGSEPPVLRTNNDFDAPAKLLIEVDDQYTSQVMSIVMQFQLLKHFCEITGQYEKDNPAKPLDLCDLSNKREIGPLVNRAMSLGSSKSYKEILSTMTNDNELKLDGLLEYFSPLLKWLEKENELASIDIGWTHSTACIEN